MLQVALLFHRASAAVGTACSFADACSLTCKMQHLWCTGRVLLNTLPDCSSKTLPLWNLYFHLPAVNTTSIVIQGKGHCYYLLSIVLRTNEETCSEVVGDPTVQALA